MDLHYLANYEIEHEIGQGSFATVYLGHEKTTKYKVAIKSVNLARLNKKLAENLASEITILKEISHPNIVKLYEIQKTENFIYLVMEYCHIGDLAQYLRTERVLKEGQARIFLQQLTSALKILWGNNLIHRDLKPQNLLLSEGDDGGLVIKIADFGFARYVEPTDLAETLCGSPLYMAPEILRYEKYDAKADLWSVGAIGYEMVFGHPPYRADNHIHLLRIIEKSDDLKLIFPTEITFKTSIKGLDRRYWSKTTTTSTVTIESSDLLKDLLLKLLRKDPSQRIGFQDLFSHPFVAVNEKNVQTEPQKVRGLSLHSTRRLSSSASCQSISSTDLAMTDLLHSNVEDEYLFSQLFQDLDKKAPIFASLKNYVSLVLMLDRIINIEAQQSMSLSISRALVTENKKSKAHNALLILYYNIDLLENCLDIIKSALVRATEKSSDLLNVAQLISSKLDREYEQFESVKLSIKPTAAFTSSSLSRSNSSSSFMDDNFTTNQAIDLLIFQTACRFAKEGGIQELLENLDDSQALYLLSIFLFNILLNPAEFVPITSKFAQIATCSEYNQKIILKYIDVIQDRIK